MCARVADDTIQHVEIEPAFLGSIWAQLTAASTLLETRIWTAWAKPPRRYSKFVAVSLPSSPASARNGLPSTISCVAVPRRCKWGISDAELCAPGPLWGQAALHQAQARAKQDTMRKSH